MAYGFNDDKSKVEVYKKSEVFNKLESINLNGGGTVKVIEKSFSISSKSGSQRDYYFSDVGLSTYETKDLSKIIILGVQELTGVGWVAARYYYDNTVRPTAQLWRTGGKNAITIYGYNPTDDSRTIVIMVTLLILN